MGSNKGKISGKFVAGILGLSLAAPSVFADRDNREQFTYEGAALVNFGVAAGEGFLALTLDDVYRSMTMNNVFNMGVSARVLEPGDIEYVVRAVEKSPLAGFGINELGGARLHLTFDKEQFLQNLGKKNSASLLAHAADSKTQTNTAGKVNFEVSPGGAAADEVHVKIADRAKGSFSTDKINLRTLGSPEMSRAEAIRTLLTDLQDRGVHVRSVKIQGFVPRMGGYAVGTLNIILLGSALGNAANGMFYGMTSLNYNKDYMGEICEEKGQWDEKQFDNCQEPNSLKAIFNASEAVLYYLVLDDDQKEITE